MATETIYLNNDNLLTLDQLTDQLTGQFINDATVAVTVFQADGSTQVTGATWPLSMPYVTSSDGKYQVILPDTLALAWRKRYSAHIVADAGAGKHAEWWFNFRALRRNVE